MVVNMNIFDKPLLEKILELTSIRHKVIANNVSNIDTPGYKAKSFSFEKDLQKALGSGGKLSMKTTNEGHIKPSGAVERINGNYGHRGMASLRNDGNNVDIDKEMVELSKNSLLFSGTSRILIAKFSSLENAIKEGKR